MFCVHQRSDRGDFLDHGPRRVTGARCASGEVGGPDGHVCSQGTFSEVVSISNLGVATAGPSVEESGSLLLEYVNGSACTTSDGLQTTYTTRIHLICSRGSLVRRRSSAWGWGGGGLSGLCDQSWACLLRGQGGESSLVSASDGHGRRRGAHSRALCLCF